VDFVGLPRRALASLIDNLVWLIGGSILLSLIPGSTWDDHPEIAVIVLFLLASAWFNYFAWSEWRYGQTIGKNATGIVVRPADGGERISFGQASIRNLLRIVDFFGIGEVMIAATKRRQRLGDKAAKTVVVRTQRAPAAAAPAARSATAFSIKRVAPSERPYIRGAAPERPPTPPLPAVPPPATPPPQAPPPSTAPTAKPDRGFPLVPWTVKQTWSWLAGGMLIAVIAAPLLVAPFDPELESDAAQLTAQGIFDGLLVVVALGVASGWRFRPLGPALRNLGLRPFKLSGFGWMLLMLIAYYVGAAIFSALVVQPEQEDIGKELGACASTGIAIAALFSIVIVAPFTEELFFRGFFFAGLRGRLSLWPAALVSGVVFGVVHAPTGPTAAIPLAGLGVGLAWLYEKTGSIWPSMTAHFLNNALAITVVLASC
jgi:CAAX protease family protein